MRSPERTGASPPSSTPTPPPALRPLPAEFWRQALSDQAYKIAYRACRERHFHRWPSIEELAVRLDGYGRRLYGAAAPGYQAILELCEIALSRIQRRGRQLSLDEFAAWKWRKSRAAGIRSGAARRARTADRDEEIRRERTAGQSAISLAAKHGLSRQQIYRIAARDCDVTRTISPPHPDELLNSNSLRESSESPRRDGSGYIHATDPTWIADVWQSSVEAPLETWQRWRLQGWVDEAEAGDGADIVDLVRIVEYAGRPEVRDPWRYVQAAVERRRGKGAEYRQELEAAAGEAGRRYADYGHVANRRAYLATCAANNVPEPAVADRRDGFLESYRRRYGRLPWEEPAASGGAP